MGAGLTGLWQGMKAGGTAAGAAPAAAGTAAAGGGILSGITGFLTANPLLAALAAVQGVKTIGGFLSGPSPYEQAASQQLGIGGPLISQLQQQAAGLPTAATEAQMRQLGQVQTGAQQSYAASARRQGIAGTTPARAQQGRLQAAGIEARAGLLGQAQTSAQQQLGGIYGRGLTAQAQVEAQRRQADQQFYAGLAEFMQYYRANKGEPLAEQALELFLQQAQLTMPLLRQAVAGGATAAGTAPATPAAQAASPWIP